MHIVTTFIFVVSWTILWFLSTNPDLMESMSLTDYLPPSIGSQCMQVIGGTLFLATFDFLISSIIFDAAGHVDCSTHAKLLESMITLREENDTLKLLLKVGSDTVFTNMWTSMEIASNWKQSIVVLILKRKVISNAVVITEVYHTI